MTTINPFVLEQHQYNRDIAFLRHYVEDAAKYLCVMTGEPIDKVKNFIKDSMRPGGIFEFKDPKIVYLERGDNGDRVEKEGTLLAYLTDSITHKELIAPTLTTYINPQEKESLLVKFVEENIEVRNVAKREMFAARMAQNHVLEAFKNSEQSNSKISNNSVSGGHVSTSTILYNKTAHSTLTSNCRSTSAYGNANNEKMLSGNRHYHHPSLVINNIISIANRTDMVKFQKLMEQRNLHYPSVEEVLSAIEYSTNFYWRSKKANQKFAELISKISPLERAAFLYVGDLYHFAKYNDSVLRDFITRLSTPYYDTHDEPKKVLKSTREEFHALATQLVPELMRGVDINKLDPKDPKDHTVLCALASTSKNIEKVVSDYADLIENLLVTENVPASLAFFPDSIRRSAITSDTDSTIFTVQDWVMWMTGRVSIDDQTNAIAATMIFIAAEAIVHILAKMSANFGIAHKRIHQVAMKNEFKFDVFVPTQVGKHYFANISCQEGNIYMEYEFEIKGVHLKSSNVPAAIMAKATTMMKAIMDDTAKGNKISLKKKLLEIATIEREIIASAVAGESTYFRAAQIKSPDSYKNAAQSPYQHYLMWQEIFAPKYGKVPEPPYSCLKVPVNLPNQSAIKSWIESIGDAGIRERLRAWNESTKKTQITTFLLPQQHMASKGIPAEIVQVMDQRRLMLDNTMVFYIIMETLGYYCVNDKITELISDYH